MKTEEDDKLEKQNDLVSETPPQTETKEIGESGEVKKISIVAKNALPDDAAESAEETQQNNSVPEKKANGSEVKPKLNPIPLPPKTEAGSPKEGGEKKTAINKAPEVKSPPKTEDTKKVGSSIGVPTIVPAAYTPPKKKVVQEPVVPTVETLLKKQLREEEKPHVNISANDAEDFLGGDAFEEDIDEYDEEASFDDLIESYDYSGIDEKYLEDYKETIRSYLEDGYDINEAIALSNIDLHVTMQMENINLNPMKRFGVDAEFEDLIREALYNQHTPENALSLASQEMFRRYPQLQAELERSARNPEKIIAKYAKNLDEKTQKIANKRLSMCKHNLVERAGWDPDEAGNHIREVLAELLESGRTMKEAVVEIESQTAYEMKYAHIDNKYDDVVLFISENQGLSINDAVNFMINHIDGQAEEGETFETAALHAIKAFRRQYNFYPNRGTRRN